MIKSINLCQNIQVPQNLAFKSKQDNISMTSPIESTNLNGTSALASYNSSLVKDKFDIPLLKPIQMPKDINAIDGERIYNSKGVLQCIVKDAGDKKYVYSNKYDSFYLKIYDKKTGNILFEQEESESSYANINGNSQEKHHNCWLTEYNPITGKVIATAIYADGVPILKNMDIRNSDGSYERRGYSYSTAEYRITGTGAPNDLNYYEKIYDSNKNLLFAYYEEQMPDSNIRKEIKYIDGKEVSNQSYKTSAIMNPELQKYLHNPELKPAECPEFITNIDNIEGEKTYYSNGQLESVRTKDGKIYETSLDGKCITLNDRYKTIEFTVDQYFGDKRCDITEENGNEFKRTYYIGKNGDELSDIFYKKGNIEKSISYENGKPRNYYEYDTSKDCSEQQIISIDYAPNGGVLDVRRREDF